MTNNSQTDSKEDPFAGIARLYGTQAYALIKDMHVCVIGIGGVGSWVVEALARSAVGKITILILIPSQHQISIVRYTLCLIL